MKKPEITIINRYGKYVFISSITNDMLFLDTLEEVKEQLELYILTHDININTDCLMEMIELMAYVDEIESMYRY